MIKIKQINISNLSIREKFLRLPYQLALNYPMWIPGFRLINRQIINPAKNPFLKDTTHHFYIVEKNNEIVGRVAIFGPGHWKDNSKVVTFGFLDFGYDETICKLISETIEQKAKSLGATHIIGPLNPNIHYDVGFLTKGFEFNNSVFLGFNPDYYSSFFVQLGWKKKYIFQSWQIDKESYNPHIRFINICERSNKVLSLNFRKINIKNFNEELRLFYFLYCESFKNHWGFTKPSFNEFEFIAGSLRYFLKKEMGIIAEFGGKPVGFILGIPDIYQLLRKDRSGRLFPLNWWRILTKLKSIDKMRVMIAGILPAFQHKGIHVSMFKKYTEDLFSGSIRSGEIGWVMKGNISLEKTLTLMNAKPIKEYTLFEKKLS